MHLLLALVDSPNASASLGLSRADITAARDDVHSQLDR